MSWKHFKHQETSAFSETSLEKAAGGSGQSGTNDCSTEYKRGPSYVWVESCLQKGIFINTKIFRNFTCR